MQLTGRKEMFLRGTDSKWLAVSCYCYSLSAEYLNDHALVLSLSLFSPVLSVSTTPFLSFCPVGRLSLPPLLSSCPLLSLTLPSSSASKSSGARCWRSSWWTWWCTPWSALRARSTLTLTWEEPASCCGSTSPPSSSSLCCFSLQASLTWCCLCIKRYANEGQRRRRGFKLLVYSCRGIFLFSLLKGANNICLLNFHSW